MKQMVIDFEQEQSQFNPVGLEDLIYYEQRARDIHWYSDVGGLLCGSAERAAMALGIKTRDDFLKIVKTASPHDIVFKDLGDGAKKSICKHIAIERKSPEFYKTALALIACGKNQPQPHESVGFVYWMKSERSGLHKIGFSLKPERRVSDLRVAVPDIEIKDYRKGTEKHEKEIHKILSDYSVGGEWFCTSNEDITAAIDLILPNP